MEHLFCIELMTGELRLEKVCVDHYFKRQSYNAKLK